MFPYVFDWLSHNWPLWIVLSLAGGGLTAAAFGLYYTLRDRALRASE